MDEIKMLEDILEKKTKELSKKDREDVVEALSQLAIKNHDYDEILRYLYKFHYSVSGDFFDKLSKVVVDEKVLNMVEAMISSSQFKADRTYYKELSAMLALATKGKYQISFSILSGILKKSDKGGFFADGCLKNFKSLIVDKNGMQYIEKIYEGIEKREIKYAELDKMRLDRFLKTIEDQNNLNNNKARKIQQNEIVEKEENQHKKSPKESIVDENDIKKKDSLEENTFFKVDDTESAIKRIDKAQKEILVKMQVLTENRLCIEALTAALAQRDEEMLLMNRRIAERENKILSLINEDKEKEIELTNQKQQIDDLTERLRKSMQMDDISKKQEMLTLKNDISEALKLDYEDFVKSKEKPYEEDLFEAYRSTLSRIFKLLKRFGIDCQ